MKGEVGSIVEAETHVGGGVADCLEAIEEKCFWPFVAKTPVTMKFEKLC